MVDSNRFHPANGERSANKDDRRVEDYPSSHDGIPTPHADPGYENIASTGQPPGAVKPPGSGGKE